MARFFVVLGIITMVLSGGCSAFYGVALFNSEYSDATWLVLLFGGVPFGVGLIMYLIAR